MGRGKAMSKPQLLQRSFTIPEILFWLFTCDAVFFLYLSGEHVAFSSNDDNMVVCGFAQPARGLFFELLPVPYE